MARFSRERSREAVEAMGITPVACDYTTGNLDGAPSTGRASSRRGRGPDDVAHPQRAGNDPDAELVLRPRCDDRQRRSRRLDNEVNLLPITDDLAELERFQQLIASR
jgi:hypothetical protein